ncbi:MAG: hypothetical protein GXO89_00230 [Chlorobi bacterium]|nr:hypothetical protein [Chlorobiota bacterium]
MKVLKKDHFLFGFIIGILFPTLLYGIIWIINLIVIEINGTGSGLDNESHVLLSFVGNLLILRYYFINLKYDKTGRGIIVVTFISIILSFILKGNL